MPAPCQVRVAGCNPTPSAVWRPKGRRAFRSKPQSTRGRSITVVALEVSRRANSTAFVLPLRGAAQERIGKALEPQQPAQLASRVPHVVTRGCQESESFDVFACGALANESPGDRIANPGGHCATGGDVPSAGVEALDCRFEPRLRSRQVGPGVTWGDGCYGAGVIVNGQ